MAQGREAVESLVAEFDIYTFSQEQALELRVSPDNRHLAYMEAAGSYDKIGNEFLFSADGTLAYRAGLGKDQFIVAGGIEGPHFDQVDNPILVQMVNGCSTQRKGVNIGPL